MPSNVYQNNSNNNNYLQNTQNLVSQFNEFKNTLQGNPQQMVQQLLRSGRMSQQDYNNYYQMANEFMKILPK